MNLVRETLPPLDCTIRHWIDGPASAPLVAFTYGATGDHQDWDAARDILNAMPVWAEHEPFVEPAIIRSFRQAPNLNQPDVIYMHLLAFLNSQTGESQVTPHEGG